MDTSSEEGYTLRRQRTEEEGIKAGRLWEDRDFWRG
jgi:hypothetical protein